MVVFADSIHFPKFKITDKVMRTSMLTGLVLGATVGILVTNALEFIILTLSFIFLRLLYFAEELRDAKA